jgi:hypothetical protein
MGRQAFGDKRRARGEGKRRRRHTQNTNRSYTAQDGASGDTAVQAARGQSAENS